MGKVVCELSMSLDGFVAGPNDSVDLSLGEGGERLFQWYYMGDTDFPLPGTDMVFRIAQASADLLRDEWGSLGAMVCGRRMFDIAQGWGGHPPGGGPCFVLTQHPPAEWSGPDSPFTFVTGGISSAIAQARAAAGDKDVSVSSASVVQQCLKAGLLDQINVNLVPTLLGGGVSMFASLGIAALDLETINVVAAPGVTHLRYRVVK